MAELTVIKWRDIPAQVLAKDNDNSERALLQSRYQEAIDAAAMVAGLTESDDYLTQWVRDVRPCGDDLAADVAAEVERIEGEWTDQVLRAAIRAGGVRAEEPA